MMILMKMKGMGIDGGDDDIEKITAIEEREESKSKQ